MADKPKIDIRLSDNLELMAEIKDNTVDLIYCDILYGTGRNFGDYQDLKPIRSEIESHYLPRLIEMKRVLKTTGSIYLQMDTRINHWVRCIMDDVFGYDNFRNDVVWAYTSGGVGNKSFACKHDNIIIYTKSEDYIFNKQYYKRYVDKSKGYDPRIEYYKDTENGKEYRLNIMTDVWNDIGIISPNGFERKGYATQKPKALIERIIKASSNEGDLVADFYAGSFTTAEVCKDLNRNFIGCDISEKAVQIGKKRVEKNILLRANEQQTLFKDRP